MNIDWLNFVGLFLITIVLYDSLRNLLIPNRVDQEIQKIIFSKCRYCGREYWEEVNKDCEHCGAPL